MKKKGDEEKPEEGWHQALDVHAALGLWEKDASGACKKGSNGQNVDTRAFEVKGNRYHASPRYQTGHPVGGVSKPAEDGVDFKEGERGAKVEDPHGPNLLERVDDSPDQAPEKNSGKGAKDHEFPGSDLVVVVAS
jgi:hypothetical protein